MPTRMGMGNRVIGESGDLAIARSRERAMALRRYRLVRRRRR
jgi:hypothetical protein